MPQIAPINSSLEYAIDTANTNRLRIALHHVRNQVPTAAHELQRILLVPESRAKCEVIDLDTESEVDSQQDPEDEDEDGSSVSSQAPDETESEESGESKDDRHVGRNGEEDPGSRKQISQIGTEVTSKKRMRPRYTECENCGEEFDVTRNERKLCRYHPGMYPHFPQLFLALG